MLVTAVARVEHGAVDLVGDELHRARGRMADDDRVGAHRVQRHRGVDQRFALLHARLRGVHVDDVGAEPLARDLEGEERAGRIFRSEEHTSELQSLMRISYAVFCLKKKNKTYTTQ